MKQNDKTLCMLENRERRDRKTLCRAISDFQQSCQRPETRREFDLSDPLALQKALPARVSDSDLRNTISGMQKFLGEDLNFPVRKKFQEEQNREWSLQQQREWEDVRADQKAAGEGLDSGTSALVEPVTGGQSPRGYDNNSRAAGAAGTCPPGPHSLSGCSSVVTMVSALLPDGQVPPSVLPLPCSPPPVPSVLPAGHL